MPGILPAKATQCPYCGESIELIVDDSVDYQEYVEDCPVCCRPISVTATVDEHAGIRLVCRTDSEA